jgi:protein-S-isoprenylcysteine O-methyltransferase Ste14
MTIAFGLQRFFGDIRYHRERYRQFLGVAFIVLISFAGQPQFPMYWIGAVMVVAGVAIRLWASGHVKKDKVLATDGPYAYVRHPLYVGNLILLFGFSLASGLWWSFPVLIVFLLTRSNGKRGTRKHMRLSRGSRRTGTMLLASGHSSRAFAGTVSRSSLCSCFPVFLSCTSGMCIDALWRQRCAA